MYISEFDIIFLFYETVLTWCRDYPYYCDISGVLFCHFDYYSNKRLLGC